MHSLVVVIFDDINQAEAFRLHCRTDPAAAAVDCAKVVAVERDPQGQIHFQSSHSLARDGAIIGGVWGMLVGFLFLNPLAGVMAGAGIGAGLGELGDIGISKDFLKKLGVHLKPGSSALFIPVASPKTAEVEKLLQATGGIVLSAKLTTEDEKALEKTLQAIADHKATAAPEKTGQANTVQA